MNSDTVIVQTARYRFRRNCATVARFQWRGPPNRTQEQSQDINGSPVSDVQFRARVDRDDRTAGALVLSGWWFDIATGDMYAYERTSRSFEVIDRAMADRMIARLAARVR